MKRLTRWFHFCAAGILIALAAKPGGRGEVGSDGDLAAVERALMSSRVAETDMTAYEADHELDLAMRRQEKSTCH